MDRDIFGAFVRRMLDSQLTLMQKKVRDIEAYHTAKGCFRSGATLIKTGEAVRETYEEAIKQAVATIPNADKQGLSRSDAFGVIRELNDEYAPKAELRAKHSKYKDWAAQNALRSAKERYLQLADVGDQIIADFEAGLCSFENETVSTQTLSIGANYGAVQQGHGTLYQSSSIAFTLEQKSQALEAIKKIEEKCEVPDELQADINTLKAQLSKEKPSPTILNEALSSARNVAEGAMSGVAAQTVIALLARAGSSIGF